MIRLKRLCCCWRNSDYEELLEMDRNHRLRIINCAAELRRAINFELLLPKLRESRIFPEDMLLDIQTCGPTNEDRLDMLLKFLPKRGPTAFQKFLHCLSYTGNLDAVRILQDESVEMDTWDGNVKKAPYYNNGASIQTFYPMKSRPRGVAVILSFTDFHGILETRVGGELDVTALQTLFNELGFVVDTHCNLTAQETKAVITSFKDDQRLKSADACIITCLSHGKGEGFYCSDHNLIKTNWMLEQFNNENCIYLRAKPKIFFLQHCRGDEIDHAIPSVGHWSTDSIVLQKSLFCEGDEEPYSLAKWSDMKICYSTSKDMISFRSKHSGTFFIYTLVNVLSTMSHNTHLDDMMKEVTSRMLTFEIHGWKQATEIRDRGWRKNLYFNPGLYEDNE